MEINTALVLRERILEVVGKTGDTGKFVSRYRIEIGIASTTIDSAVTVSDVGEPRRIVVPNRNTTRDICHPVMGAVTPLQCHKRTEITNRCECIRNGAHTRRGNRSELSSQRPANARVGPTEQPRDANRQLSAKHRSGKGVGGRQEQLLAMRVQIGIQTDIYAGQKAADLDFSGS